MRSIQVTARSILVFLVPAFLLTNSTAAALIIGGPTYDATTQTGYQSGGLGGVAGTAGGGAVAVGGAIRYAPGVIEEWRAVRWNSSGATAAELGNLSTDPDGGATFPYAINSAGTAVGSSQKFVSGTNGGSRAVRWGASGAVTELGNLGTDGNGVTAGTAYAINTAGTTVGNSTKFDLLGSWKGDRAVRWDASGTAATELGNLGVRSDGYATSGASAINSAGIAVGFAQKFVSDIDKGNRAVRWNAVGAATELGNLGTNSNGVTTSNASAINDAGTAVGIANKYVAGSNKGQRAARWDASGTAATELGNLGTDSNGVTSSSAVAINSAGTVVGVADKYVSGINKGQRGVRWDASGTAATELGDLGTGSDGVTVTQVYGINGDGIAVGNARLYDSGGFNFSSRPVAWGLNGAAIDLNTLLDPGSGWVLTHATGISDTNWVSGYGDFDPDGPGGQGAYERLFLLDVSSVVPEPGSSVLLIAAAVPFMRRARAKRDLRA